MKWVVVLAFIVLAVIWTNFLKTDRRAPYVTGLLIGFLPFVIQPWHLVIAPYSFAGWSGFAKGYEVSLIDVLAVAVLSSGRFRGWQPRLTWPAILYLLAVLITVPMARFPTFAAAYPLQLVRMVMVLIAVTRLASSPEGAKGVFYGLVCGLSLQCLFALQARAQGAVQTGGTFGHQNLLGYATHMVLLPSFALLLAGRWTRMAALGLAAGVIVIIVGASRATIMIAAIGLGMTYLVAAITNWTGRKGVVGFVMLGLAIVSIPLVQGALNKRFQVKGGSLLAEDKEREQFENAAGMIIRDHPFGIGPNHYVYIVNIDGYNNRAKVGYAQGSRTAHVHNSYYLVHAETGMLGLLTFVGFLGSAVITLILQAKKHARGGYAELIAGVGCAVLAAAIHSNFEWMFVTFQIQYVLFIAIGLAAGCILQSERRKKKPRPRRAMADEDATPEPALSA